MRILNHIIHVYIYEHNNISVASQQYRIGSEEEYVIDGNDALLKCKIPSFVSDFVHVVNWEDDEQNILYPNKNYGNESE